MERGTHSPWRPRPRGSSPPRAAGARAAGCEEPRRHSFIRQARKHGGRCRRAAGPSPEAAVPRPLPGRELGDGRAPRRRVPDGRGLADGGARPLLLLPPAPDPARCQGNETSRLSQPRSSPLPDPSSPVSRGGAKERRGGERPHNPPAGEGRDTRGTKTPGTTTAAPASATGSAAPEARPLVGSCYSPGYDPSLLFTDLSLPPRRPAIPLQPWNGNAPAPIGCVL